MQLVVLKATEQELCALLCAKTLTAKRSSTEVGQKVLEAFRMYWTVPFPSKHDSPGPATGDMCWMHVLPTGLSVLQRMTAPDLPRACWTVGTCSFIYRCCALFFFFHSKLCTSLSIPSKMLDAKSPQGMCQRLLNTLCTLSLILHGFGFTVEEMQMAAHGIALWGNKGNTAYFSFFLLS